MRLISWNIAGAHTFSGNVQDASSYEKEDLEYFTSEIAKSKAELIGLQEAHSSYTSPRSQAKIISEKLGFTFFTEHQYGQSHIKKVHQLALANISKYPIFDSYFHKLLNPNLIVKRPNGDTWISLSVGFLISVIEINGVKINFVNCHLVPFHYFKRDFSEPEFQAIRDDITSLLKKLYLDPTIVVGDFNYDNLTNLLPQVFINDKYKEAFTNIKTTPGKGQQDHILFSKHWELQSYNVEKTKSDHYLCIVDLTITNK